MSGSSPIPPTTSTTNNGIAEAQGHIERMQQITQRLKELNDSGQGGGQEAQDLIAEGKTLLPKLDEDMHKAEAAGDEAMKNMIIATMQGFMQQASREPD